MTRYFLRELAIEGFRGINNAGAPLTISFNPAAVNSIHAPNGVGKTSIYEAIHFAIFGDVPRLRELQTAEHPESYINNRFHTGDAFVEMTFLADDGTPDVAIHVRRTNTGVRSTTSPTGHTDPEAFLRSLREDFVLVDYHKFARFIDNTALVRGRSFASLVGLSRYSALRAALDGAKHTQSLNADFEIKLIETEIKTGERELAEYARLGLAAYAEVTGVSAADLSDIPTLCATATKAMAGIELLADSIGAADILTVQLETLESIVEAAEGGNLRPQHAALGTKVAALTALAPVSDEATERTELLYLAQQRDAAMLKAGSILLRNLYDSASTVLGGDDWTDLHLCPVCDTKTERPLDQHLDHKLAVYAQADALNVQLAELIAKSQSLGRLARLEASNDIGEQATVRHHANISSAASKHVLTTIAL